MSRPDPDIRLAKCPFCGCGATVASVLRQHFGRCGECDADGPVASNEASAIEAWNFRYDPATGSTESALGAGGAQ